MSTNHGNRSVWTKEEDDLLRVNYRLYGPSWEDWETLLPGRSMQAIRMRAHRLDLSKHIAKKGEGKRKRKHPDLRHREIDTSTIKDPRERVIRRRMMSGMSLQEIDRKYHWRPGTARRTLVAGWEREGKDDGQGASMAEGGGPPPDEVLPGEG